MRKRGRLISRWEGAIPVIRFLTDIRFISISPFGQETSYMTNGSVVPESVSFPKAFCRSTEDVCPAVLLELRRIHVVSAVWHFYGLHSASPMDGTPNSLSMKHGRFGHGANILTRKTGYEQRSKNDAFVKAWNCSAFNEKQWRQLCELAF